MSSSRLRQSTNLIGAIFTLTAVEQPRIYWNSSVARYAGKAILPPSRINPRSWRALSRALAVESLSELALRDMSRRKNATEGPVADERKQ
jgi:hypothetical protein